MSSAHNCQTQTHIPFYSISSTGLLSEYEFLSWSDMKCTYKAVLCSDARLSYRQKQKQQ